MNHLKPSAVLALLSLLPGAIGAEPILSSWYTEGSGRYARIWATLEQETTERSGGGTSSLTTWDSADYDGVTVGDQPLPVYAGVQGISYSDSYVYIKSTGLANNTMGPWFLDGSRTTRFPSFPGNAAILYRFPRSPSYSADYSPASRSETNIGSCGLFVDGVPLFNTSDTFSYDTSAGADQEPTNTNLGDGIWNRDAFVNEGVSFDAGNAHQAMEAFHYHASPAALRSTLGDSVDYDSSVVYEGIGGASPYSENFNGQHSPIIGWVNDGLPMYGPYGYSDPTDPDSGVRRMITGYQKRDGSNGSTDLTVTGRTTLPQWKVDQDSGTASRTLSSSQYGPSVSTTFVLGHYMEDYASKADLVSDASGEVFQQYFSASLGTFDASKHYDLNEYNVRYCVTPEFPEGTWAYFTSVEEDGTPAYPYNLAFQYFGDATSAAGIASSEVESQGVTVYFEGATEIEPAASEIAVDDSTVTITWEGTEGGIYRVDPSTDLATFDTSGETFTADLDVFATTGSKANAAQYYRLTRTGLETYDTTEFSSETAGGPGGPGGPPGPF